MAEHVDPPCGVSAAALREDTAPVLQPSAKQVNHTHALATLGFGLCQGAHSKPSSELCETVWEPYMLASAKHLCYGSLNELWSLRTICTLHAGPAPAWESSAEQLNRAPLLARDPILYYDEVPLYESELDDNGVSQLSVKARHLDPCRERLCVSSTCYATVPGSSRWKYGQSDLCAKPVHLFGMT